MFDLWTNGGTAGNALTGQPGAETVPQRADQTESKERDDRHRGASGLWILPAAVIGAGFWIWVATLIF